MGGHYGSIHVRTDDAESVQSAVYKLAQDGKLRFLVASAIKGWVSAFPWNNGQDSSIAAKLAELLPDKEFIQCLVHDDDLFAYWYYQKGSLKDRYNSCPDYFDDSNTEPRGGNAQVLAHLLAKPGTVSKLQALLDKERFDFEVERLDQFAKLLDLPNAVTAYEYLQSGKRDGIKHWRKFVHVPDLSGERDAQREAAAKVRDEMNRLKSEGILLADLVGPKSLHKLIPSSPLWCVNPAANDVLFCWNQVNFALDAPRLPLTRSPASNWKPVPTGIELPTNIWDIACSHAGKWLAVGSQLWNLETGKLMLDLSQVQRIGTFCFSPNDEFLFGASEQSIMILSLPDLKVTATIPLSGGVQEIAVHPQGHLLAVTDTGGVLHVVDIKSSRVLTQTWIEEKKGLLPPAVVAAAGLKMTGRILEMLKGRMSEAEIEKYRSDSARHFLAKDRIRTAAFSADGRWLFCGTTDGMHALEWKDVLACPEMTAIKPWFTAEVEAITEDLGGGTTTQSKLTYAVLFDEPRQRVLFCGLDGKIRYFELANGHSGNLLIPPEPLPMNRLALLPDRSALICTVLRIDLQKKWPPHFQIWNYPALCRAAGIAF